MKILVTGGTGNVGRLVVKELLARGAEVRVLAQPQQLRHSVRHRVCLISQELAEYRA